MNVKNLIKDSAWVSVEDAPIGSTIFGGGRKFTKVNENAWSGGAGETRPDKEMESLSSFKDYKLTTASAAVGTKTDSSSRRLRKLLRRSDAADAAVLSEGFTPKAFEDFVILNSEEIRANMETYGFTTESLPKVDNYFDLANILGSDSRFFKDTDVNYWAKNLAFLLEDEEDFLSDAEVLSIVDILWVLRSSGVAYESRKAMAVSDDEYREYLMGLITDNDLTSLLGTIGDSADDSSWDNSMIESLESETGVVVIKHGLVGEDSEELGNAIVIIAPDLGIDDPLTVYTSEMSFSDVASAVLGNGFLKDSVSPETTISELVAQDIAETVEQDWSPEDYASYLHDVPAMYSAPQFAWRAGVVSKAGDVDEESTFIKKLLEHNEKSLRAQMFEGGYEEMDLYQYMLHEYTSELERELVRKNLV